ncbi:MAG TPA: ferritin-like domain-containing protein [Acidimicrobiales bacterium]|nr:ferritin-like domain-containing protein [Acidimicrobiales bacterium]
MTTTELPELPDRETLDGTFKVIEDHCDRIYTWNYERSRPKLVTLYNKAAQSQWASVTDLDWSTEVDPESLVDTDAPNLRMIREVTKMPGSPIASWGEREITKLGLEMFTAMLSQFMHGEQGAMMTAAKIVETVPWIDAKYYAATQTMDEARHTEVFARYLDEKVGEAYPMNPNLEAQITGLLEDSRWDIAYLGMQIVIESLALAAFGDMLRRTTEPLLRKLLRYVMADEARHVAFGILSLGEYYRDLSAAELKERQEFLLEHTINSRARSTTPEIWERMGVKVEQVVPFIIEAASKMNKSPFLQFQRGFFAKLVPNVRKLGLLDANDGYLRQRWGEAGLMEFEFADADTSEDYANYDAVAADRAAAGAVADQPA